MPKHHALNGRLGFGIRSWIPVGIEERLIRLYRVGMLLFVLAVGVSGLGVQEASAQPDPVSEITDSDGNTLMIVYENGELEVTGGFVLPDGTLIDEASDLGSGGGSFTLPFSASASSTDPLLQLTQTGDGRAGDFAIENPGGFTDALRARSNGTGNAFKGLQTGSGRAGLFQILNETSEADALKVTTNGTGRAGEFLITDVDNGSAALFVETVGIGGAGRFEIANAQSGANALRAETNGSVGGHAGLFEITNASNDSSALQAIGEGGGPALHGIKRGTEGRAGLLEINDPANTEAALWAETNGTGPAVVGHQLGDQPDSSAHAGLFQIENPTSAAEALLVETSGEGEAVEAVQSGTGPGAAAGSFLNTDPQNEQAALRAKNFGTGFAAKLVADRSATVIDNPHGNAALIRNISDQSGPDVLGLQAGPSNPGVGVNYLSFYDRTGSSVGAIEGNGSGGVNLKTSGADYAEALPIQDGSARPKPGELVGVRSGHVGLETEGAERLMVVTGQAAVLGNADFSSGRGEARRVPVAFLGQVPVKVRGSAAPGELIVASGRADGTTEAVAPSAYRRAKHGPIAGQVWSSKRTPGVGEVTVAVGLGRSGTVAERLERQHRQIDSLRDRLRGLEELRERQQRMARELALLERRRSEPLRAGTSRIPIWAVLLGAGGFLAGLWWRHRE